MLCLVWFLLRIKVDQEVYWGKWYEQYQKCFRQGRWAYMYPVLYKMCMELANYNSIAIFNGGLHSYEEMKTLKLKTL